MHEGLTLEKQRENEVARGWKPTWSALTYCTAEAVIYRVPMPNASIIDYEILDAIRTGGSPDCIGKHQGKWGTYVKPTDKSALHACERAMNELFGWTIKLRKNDFRGIIGPSVFKATLTLLSRDSEIQLNVTEEQGESTPFEAKIFLVNATHLELLSTANFNKSTRDAQWITIRDLIATQGQNPDYLYWSMIYRCVGDQTWEYDPGEYRFPLR